jgi:hypothetical protein
VPISGQYGPKMRGASGADGQETHPHGEHAGARAHHGPQVLTKRRE